jgi:hypothetical protein
MAVVLTSGRLLSEEERRVSAIAFRILTWLLNLLDDCLQRKDLNTISVPSYTTAAFEI